MADSTITNPLSSESIRAPKWTAERRRRDGRLVQTCLVILTLILAIVIWELVVIVFAFKEYILPTPRDVASELWSARSLLGSALAVTLKETLIGFLIAAVVGVTLACGIASSRIVERMLYPVLVITNAVPIISVAPLFLVWFGLGSTSRILVAALIAGFPIVISSAVGLVGVDEGIILVARSMNANSWRIFANVRMPAALPSILGGLKLGITLSLTGAVVGEFIGGNSGLGYIITDAQGNLEMPLAFAAIVVLALVGVVLFYIVEVIEKLLVH